MHLCILTYLYVLSNQISCKIKSNLSVYLHITHMRYQIAKCHRPNFQKKRTFPVPTETDLQSKLNQSYFIGVHGLPPPHLKLIWFLILTACKKTHLPSTSHARIFHRESLDWFKGKKYRKALCFMGKSMVSSFLYFFPRKPIH